MYGPESYFKAGDYVVLPSEVRKLFRVTDDTLNRWKREGRLELRKTPGGICRYSYRQLCDALGVLELPDFIRRVLTVPLR